VDDCSAEAAFRRHYAEVSRFVRRHGAAASDADDLVQQVFADAVGALATARLDAPPTLAWLYTVARRRLIDLRRRAGRTSDRTIPLEAVDDVPAGDAAYGQPVAEALTRAVRRLPRSQQRVVVLKLFEGRSFAEIARRLAITEPAAKMRCVRGLERLKELLEQEGLQP
jgi:RNA polymerase sigma-70 factor (ECF subfamily)